MPMSAATESTPPRATPQKWATWKLVALGAGMLWLVQPPLRLWPLAWIALVPWMLLASRPTLTRRDYLLFYLGSLGHWLLTMQGIRHAHPGMYLAWPALSAYLAVYPVVWLVLVRILWRSRTDSDGTSPGGFRALEVGLAVPVVWTGLECLRNYLLTGISAAMLGHALVDVPILVQIADTWGSYGVTFLVALVNAAIFLVCLRGWARQPATQALGKAGKTTAWVASAAVVATLVYGGWRLREAAQLDEVSSTTIALLGRDEPIEFDQTQERELQIFDSYYLQAVDAARAAESQQRKLGAVVWPESMFTGAMPWIVADPDRPLARFPGQIIDDAAVREIIAQRQAAFQQRAYQIQVSLRQITGQDAGPDLLGGTSVIRYDDPPGGHSGCVWIGDQGRVRDWYAKTHLVMFGEYIPLIEYLPFVERWVPAGMGVLPGSGPIAMPLGDLVVLPSVCIETAVERVTVNHLRDLRSQRLDPDVVVNVTNDGWFNRTSIVEHHLRCSQMVAIASRRPILIAANGGPTAWIDSSGRIVQRVPTQYSGAILANVTIDRRTSPMVRIGDWPARGLAMICFAVVYLGWRRRHRPCGSLASR